MLGFPLSAWHLNVKKTLWSQVQTIKFKFASFYERCAPTKYTNYIFFLIYMKQIIANTSVYIPSSMGGTTVNLIQEQPGTEIRSLYVNAFRKQYINNVTNFLLGE
jgi:hypothetical protein